PKGDPLCPLGFHPQVRWTPSAPNLPLRDYKEHGPRKEESFRRDETTVSSPSLSSWSSPSSRSRDDNRSGSSSSTDSGVSSHNSKMPSLLSKLYANTILLTQKSGTDDVFVYADENNGSGFIAENSGNCSRFSSGRPATSWTSTPDLGNLNDDTRAITVNLTLPRRRPVKPFSSTDTPEPAASDSFTLRRRPNETTVPQSTKSESTTTSSTTTSTPTSTKQARSRRSTKNAATNSNSDEAKETGKLRRVRIQSLKEIHSVEEPSNPEVKSSKDKKPIRKSANATTNSISSSTASKKSSGLPTLPGASSSSSGTSEEEDSDDDLSSLAGTETTETTLVDRNENELQEQIESLKQELEMMRTRCERVEREKSDILLRRIAAMDTTSSKTAASEVLKLQQKVNELQGLAEDLRDDKKSLSLRVKELEEEVDSRPDKIETQKSVDELRSKLLAAEILCEELMDENEDMKKELRDLEEEIEEMQDNFREEQADEYTSLKKELEQTNKNCRILSFKLRKAERKADHQLEEQKAEMEKKFKDVAGGPTGLEKVEKVKKLEQELAVANEMTFRLQKELDETNAKLKAKEEASSKEVAKKKAPMLGAIGKVGSGEKVSRESLTRGGSQEDPQQLLRDLQDSLEREADLREQLRFAEEEAQTLRKKASRVEDDNESLVLQLKKMASKARSRRHSPSPARLTPEPSVEKDEGISDEDDPAELRILLELNEQEAAVLRRKVEELEGDGENLKKKVKDLQEKLLEKTSRKNTVASLSSSEPVKGTAIQEQKLKVLEDEVSELRKKLIEKDRDCERLHAELSIAQKRVSKGSLQKS
ncbi:hypothetical protein L9F63_015090, partial [Diploptera punctata]